MKLDREWGEEMGGVPSVDLPMTLTLELSVKGAETFTLTSAQHSFDGTCWSQLSSSGPSYVTVP